MTKVLSSSSEDGHVLLQRRDAADVWEAPIEKADAATVKKDAEAAAAARAAARSPSQ